MILVPPVEISGSKIQSTNAPLSDFPAYNNATAYAVGALVTFGNRDYEALVATTGVAPNTDPLTWLDLGASNRFKMFDGKFTGATSAPGTLDVTINPGEVINGLSLFGLVGNTLQIIITDPIDGVVYNRTVLLQDNSSITNYYAYFFDPIVQRSDLSMLDLPNYRTATIRLIVNAGTGTASIGELVVGRQARIGTALYGTSAGIIDYSRKERDEFGNPIIVERAFSKRSDYDVAVETASVASAQSLLARYRARPIVYIGDPARPETVVYGFFRQFNIVLSSPAISDCTIEVEGIV